MKMKKTNEKPKSQREAVIAQLHKSGSINSVQAFERYGITRLSSYIFNLRKNGLKITAKETTGKTKYGFPRRFATYSLSGKRSK